LYSVKIRNTTANNQFLLSLYLADNENEATNVWRQDDYDNGKNTGKINLYAETVRSGEQRNIVIRHRASSLSTADIVLVLLGLPEVVEERRVHFNASFVNVP